MGEYKNYNVIDVDEWGTKKVEELDRYISKNNEDLFELSSQISHYKKKYTEAYTQYRYCNKLDNTALSNAQTELCLALEKLEDLYAQYVDSYIVKDGKQQEYVQLVEEYKDVSKNGIPGNMNLYVEATKIQALRRSIYKCYKSTLEHKYNTLVDECFHIPHSGSTGLSKIIPFVPILIVALFIFHNNIADFFYFSPEILFGTLLLGVSLLLLGVGIYIVHGIFIKK